MVLSKHQKPGVWIYVFPSPGIKASRKQQHLGAEGLDNPVYLQWELLKCSSDFSQSCKNCGVCLCYLKWGYPFMMLQCSLEQEHNWDWPRRRTPLNSLKEHLSSKKLCLWMWKYSHFMPQCSMSRSWKITLVGLRTLSPKGILLTGRIV